MRYTVRVPRPRWGSRTEVCCSWWWWWWWWCRWWWNITLSGDHIPALPGSDWGKAEKGGSRGAAGGGGAGAASLPPKTVCRVVAPWGRHHTTNNTHLVRDNTITTTTTTQQHESLSDFLHIYHWGKNLAEVVRQDTAANSNILTLLGWSQVPR